MCFEHVSFFYLLCLTSPMWNSIEWDSLVFLSTLFFLLWTFCSISLAEQLLLKNGIFERSSNFDNFQRMSKTSQHFPYCTVFILFAALSVIHHFIKSRFNPLIFFTEYTYGLKRLQDNVAYLEMANNNLLRRILILSIFQLW